MSDLHGLRLTRSERIIVVALSYIFCAPLLYKNGKKLVKYCQELVAESTRQLAEEERRRELEEWRRIRDVLGEEQPVEATR